MKEYSKAYNREAIELALSEIQIHQCKTCGHPTRDGYVCYRCGEASPRAEWQDLSDSEAIQYI